MKKILYILAAAIFMLGLVGTITDLKDTRSELDSIKNYPVIKGDEIENYLSQKAQKVIVTDIKVSGSLVSDYKEIWDGEYYYIQANAKELYFDSEGEEEWYSNENSSYEVLGENLHTSVLPDEVFNPERQIFGLQLAGEAYPRNVDYEHLVEGDIKYQYYVLSDTDRYTALMMLGDGQAKLLTLRESEEEKSYILGDENRYYEYIEDFVVGDSYLLVFVGALVSALLCFIAFMLDDKKAKKAKLVYDEEDDDAESYMSTRMRYSRLSVEDKKRFWILRISGAIGFIVGLAMIIINYDSLAKIIFGTILMICGVSAYISALPNTNSVN